MGHVSSINVRSSILRNATNSAHICSGPFGPGQIARQNGCLFVSVLLAMPSAFAGPCMIQCIASKRSMWHGGINLALQEALLTWLSTLRLVVPLRLLESCRLLTCGRSVDERRGVALCSSVHCQKPAVADDQQHRCERLLLTWLSNLRLTVAIRPLVMHASMSLQEISGNDQAHACVQEEGRKED